MSPCDINSLGISPAASQCYSIVGRAMAGNLRRMTRARTRCGGRSAATKSGPEADPKFIEAFLQQGWSLLSRRRDQEATDIAIRIFRICDNEETRAFLFELRETLEDFPRSRTDTGSDCQQLARGMGKTTRAFQHHQRAIRGASGNRSGYATCRRGMAATAHAARAAGPERPCRNLERRPPCRLSPKG